jgi:hypothetical protein
MSTQRLFELGLSFGVCKRKRQWPSLATMNSFLKQGHDDGALGTDIEWDSCELTREDYESSVAAFMKGDSFKMDKDPRSWEDWFKEISNENIS